MRHLTYTLERKPNRVTLKAQWYDSTGNGETTLASLRGWKAKMLSCAFENCDGSWEEAMKVLIAIRGVSACRSRWGAEKLIDTIKAMEVGEVHFWASKMIADGKKAPSALKKLYGVS